MSDIKLFAPDDGRTHEIAGTAVVLEKSLQTLIERNLETLLGVRFLASEHPTGEKHGGRIDTLGIDENSSPVIIEYKRATNENVINQGLFYLSWLLDHRAEFKLLVLDKLGKAVADSVDWTGPRLLCIAGGFTKYDEHAVHQMGRNIELIRHRRFGDGLLLFELVNATAVVGSTRDVAGPQGGAGGVTRRSLRASLAFRGLFGISTRSCGPICSHSAMTSRRRRSSSTSHSSGSRTSRAWRSIPGSALSVRS